MTVENIVAVLLIVFMLGAVAVNEIAYRRTKRTVRDYVERDHKRDLEDTLTDLGLDKRKGGQ